MKSILVAWILGCASFVTYAADELKGKVTNVIDGNTIEITTNMQDTYKILLHGIDSPEPGQHYAEQAKKFLENLLLNKSVTIVLKGRDRTGNRVGDIHIDGKVNPQKELVRAGLAWTSEKNPEGELESLKEEARLSGKGLWGEKTPTPPWTYRRQQSLMQAKSS
jgi:micrococcal nuclease